MGYKYIKKPDGLLYHYTKRENLESILKDGRIRRFYDRETWFCASLEDTLRLMECTVMQKGKTYIDVFGIPRQYPEFVPQDYVILELKPRYQSGEWVIWEQEFAPGTPEEVLKMGAEFSRLKLGYRGDLRFYDNPVVYELSELEAEQEQELKM